MSAPERIYRSETRSPTHVIYYGEDRRVGENIAYVRTDIHEAEIDALKAELAALKAPPKVLNAEEVKEPGFYWSSCESKSNHWVPVWVLRDSTNSLYYAFPGSAADYSLKGLKFIGPIHKGFKFIGPIHTPEV